MKECFGVAPTSSSVDVGMTSDHPCHDFRICFTCSLSSMAMTAKLIAGVVGIRGQSPIAERSKSRKSLALLRAKYGQVCSCNMVQT